MRGCNPGSFGTHRAGDRPASPATCGRKFGAVYVSSLVGLLFAANTINIAADLGAMADALKLLIGGPASRYRSRAARRPDYRCRVRTRHRLTPVMRPGPNVYSKFRMRNVYRF